MTHDTTDCLKYIQKNINKFIWILRYTAGSPRINKYELKCLFKLIGKDIDCKLKRKKLMEKANEMAGEKIVELRGGHLILCWGTLQSFIIKDLLLDRAENI